jgi:hypothetical protein
MMAGLDVFARDRLDSSRLCVRERAINSSSFFIESLLQPEIDQIIHPYAALCGLLFNLA